MAELFSLTEFLEYVADCARDAFLEQLYIIHLQLDLMRYCLNVLRALLRVLWNELITCLLWNSTWFVGFFYIVPAFVNLLPEILDTVF